MSKIETFIEFFDLLKSLHQDEFLIWLTTPWKGKDKQESCLRLFAKLGLIPKLNDFDICQGNFNLKTIKPITEIREIFYEGGRPINLKDKGDSSDLTGIHKKNKKELLLTTSKNITKMNVGLLDIDKILTNFKQYEKEQYTMKLCIAIRNISDFEEMKSRIESSNIVLKNAISNAIIIDWNDLKQAFHQFQYQFKNLDIQSILNSNKKLLCLKMHQEMSVIKTMELKETKDCILWGHIQRSGKSYIIGGCIIEDSRHKDKCNYLVITTAPNETIEQQLQVFDCIQLEGFGIIPLNGTNKKPVLKDKNIIICSKQFLQTKIDSGEKITNIPWLKKMAFDIRFIDESHNGGTTTLAKKVLDYYGSGVFTIQITATYLKPCNDYGIKKDSWILWDLEDVQLCKAIDKPDSMNRLVEKHGTIIQNIIGHYSIENIIAEYSKYPELWIMTERLKPDVISEIIKETSDNHYGYSTEACFLLQQCLEDGIITYTDKFQNEEKTLEVFYRIFGKRDRFGIPDKYFPDEDVFMKKIERVCKNPLTKSRFIGDSSEPMIIMAFLPQNNIDKISMALISLLDRFLVVPDYHMISINSHTTNNPKQDIEDARDYARLSNKKGVIVFSGRQCSLGVSIHNCDIVLLLNNNTSFDMIYQMMFRCMTEGDRKRCGFVIDMNIQRVIETSIITYASLIKPSDHPRDAIRYILQERIINLNGDDWMTSFGNRPSKIDEFCHTIYNIYSSNTERALQHFIERLRFKDILLSKDEQKMFNTIFSGSNAKLTQKQKVDIQKLLDDDSEKIKNGIEKVGEEDSGSNSDSDSETEQDKKISYMDVLKHIIPLICILTIHDEGTSFIEMFHYIESNPYHYQILIDQTKSWWGDLIDSIIVKKFISIYIKYMADDTETNQIIRTIKEIFMKNITNMKELSSLIDKYLIPQELEKKTNAEVSTPHKLRQEMINKIPLEFWTSPLRVFEPCAGKGGFLIDIIDRFMIGLSSMIPDEKIRYKVIVEECLYFSDINPTNIFICKLLIDPYNEYSLHWNEGNTLELNIQEKWSIDGFHAIIGNPPYNASGNTATGNTIWQDFTKKSLNVWLLPNGYLLFVHPSGWRKPNTEKGKFFGLYDLMTKQNQMVYLEIHGIKDGQKTFKCGTRYDWYVIEKKPSYKNAIIVDEYGITNDIDMNCLSWLPNSNISEIDKILAKDDVERCPIIYDRSSYGSDKKYISKSKTSEFKYEIIHTFPNTGIRYLYSNTNKNGHFGISKVIFGQSNSKNPLIDMDGKYGMAEHSMAIQVHSKEEALNIVKVFQNPEFQSILSSCSWSNFMIDWRLFTFFRKDFWREFV